MKKSKRKTGKWYGQAIHKRRDANHKRLDLPSTLAGKSKLKP